MAKKEEVEVEPIDKLTETVYAHFTKQYGKGCIIGGDEYLSRDRMVIPFSPAVDVIIGGGIEEGSWVGVTGNPKAGKTCSLLSFAATCQRPEYGARRVFYFKIEGRLAMDHVRAIKGLDTRKGPFNIIESTKERQYTAQEFLQMALYVIKTVPGAVVIIDSVSALVSEKEMTEGIGMNQPGVGAKLFTQFVSLARQAVPVNNTIMLTVTHLISQIGGMTKGYVEKSSRALQYQYDYMLRIKQMTPWKAGDKQIGLEINWQCKTSPKGIPNGQITSYFRFGTGIDHLYEAFSLGVTAGLITKAGAWYAFDYLGLDEAPKAQGAEAAYRLLTNNPAWAGALKKEIQQVSAALATEGTDD